MVYCCARRRSIIRALYLELNQMRNSVVFMSILVAIATSGCIQSDNRQLELANSESDSQGTLSAEERIESTVAHHIRFVDSKMGDDEIIRTLRLAEFKPQSDNFTSEIVSLGPRTNWTEFEGHDCKIGIRRWVGGKTEIAFQRADGTEKTFAVSDGVRWWNYSTK